MGAREVRLRRRSHVAIASLGSHRVAVLEARGGAAALPVEVDEAAAAVVPRWHAHGVQHRGRGPTTAAVVGAAKDEVCVVPRKAGAEEGLLAGGGGHPCPVRRQPSLRRRLVAQELGCREGRLIVGAHGHAPLFGLGVPRPRLAGGHLYLPAVRRGRAHLGGAVGRVPVVLVEQARGMGQREGCREEGGRPS